MADLLASRGVVEDVALMRPMLGGIFAPREGDDPAEIAVTVATPNLFDMLGVTPMLGRSIAAKEIGPGRPNLIVLTHGLWNRIGADPTIVGRDVRLQGNAYTVVGVSRLPRVKWWRSSAPPAPRCGARRRSRIADCRRL